MQKCYYYLRIIYKLFATLFSNIQTDMPDCTILKQNSLVTLSRKRRAFYNRYIVDILLTVEKVSKLKIYILHELMETVRVHLIITNNIIFCFHTDILCHFPQYLRDLRPITYN